jgi:hypothetical protein
VVATVVQLDEEHDCVTLVLQFEALTRFSALHTAHHNATTGNMQVAQATIDKSTKLDERRDEIAALKMELTEVKDDFKGMHCYHYMMHAQCKPTQCKPTQCKSTQRKHTQCKRASVHQHTLPCMLAHHITQTRCVGASQTVDV